MRCKTPKCRGEVDSKGLCKRCYQYEYMKTYMPRWNRGRGYSLKLLHKYGLTVEDYDVLLEKQGGVCAVCRQRQAAGSDGKVRRLAVDHCHRRKKVRGLLCSGCNTALGLLRDDPLILAAALSYLKATA